MVILTHASEGWVAAASTFRDTSGEAPSLHIPQWLSVVSGGAAHGVTLFFLVSAFTLTLSVAGRPLDLRKFFVRRIARVAPGYWLAGLGYTLLAGAAPRLWAPLGVSVHDFLIAAFFGSAWLGGPSFAVVPGGWSVSVEMTFYLLLPLLIIVINGRLWRALLLFGLALIAAQLRTRHEFVVGSWSFAEYCNPIIQFPVFLLGIVAAMFVRRFDPRCPAIAAPLALLVAIFVVPFSPIPDWHILTSVQFALVSVIAVVVAATRPSKLLSNAAIRRVGEVSYSMYLVHFIVLPFSLYIAEQAYPEADWKTFVLHFLITVIIAFVLSCVTYRFVEQPFVRWAHRSVGKSARPVTAVQPS